MNRTYKKKSANIFLARPLHKQLCFFEAGVKASKFQHLKPQLMYKCVAEMLKNLVENSLSRWQNSPK